MWASAIWSPTRIIALTVVPMPVSSGCSNTVSASSELAAISADWSANSASAACLVLAVGLADAVHGDRGGDVAARVAAHPVGDDEQVASGVAGVLVVGADLADVGDGRRLVGRRHGYRRSSNVVVPILIGVSSGTWVGTVTRRPSRNVPLVESRSWIIHSSFQRSRRAWWVEV